MNNLLTISIPTYNRKELLISQLKRIFSLKESDKVSIVICDNHSDYDINVVLKEELSEDQIKQITIHSNPYNFGLKGNLTMPFLYCNTPWMWTLSDDDEIESDSLSTILDNISKYSDTIMFKYQIVGFQSYNDTVVASLPELIDFYFSGKSVGGHYIFLSNNVYNMKYVKRYYGMTLANCYCVIAQLLPMMHALDAKAGVVRIMNKAIVNFEPRGSSWSYLDTVDEISTTCLHKYNLSDKYYKRLGFVVLSSFAHYRVILSALDMKDRKRGKFLYNQIYSRSYKYSGSFVDKLYHLFFYFCYYTHFKVDFDRALAIREKVRKISPSAR